MKDNIFRDPLYPDIVVIKLNPVGDKVFMLEWTRAIFTTPITYTEFGYSREL